MNNPDVIKPAYDVNGGSLKQPCSAALVLTQHALERYMERSGQSRVVKSLNKLERLAARAVQISKKHFYADGWILKIVDGEIVTVYRPKLYRDMRRIYKAMKPHNDQAQRACAKDL